MLITRSCGREVQRVLITERSRREVQGYLSPEDAANKDATIAKYEKESKRVKVAMENGIPYELAGKLSGETEDEMKKDAEAFSKFLKGKPHTRTLHETQTIKTTRSEKQRKKC